MNYVAFFRGINVGGKNKVAMNELRQLFLDLGLFPVKTYIQSGNVVFDADLDEAALQDMIHAGFAERFGFESKIILRNMEEIGFLIEQLPITPSQMLTAEAADPQVEHLYVFFLDKPAEQPQIEALCKDYDGPDLLLAGNRELYFLCHQSIRNSKLAVRLGKTFVFNTSRNWKTVCGIYDMLTAL